MPAKRYSTEQIVSKLRQAEVELRRDLRVPVVCKQLGISEPTYYRWRKEYGGLRLDQAKRLKELERETTRLKKLVARRLRSIHVIETLAQLFVTYGVPAHLRSDNGAEFTATRVRLWLQALDVETLFIEPGSPWENGYVESFTGKLREELLDREVFYTLTEAKVLIERWRRQYNTVRPHSALGYRPPAPEVISPAPLSGVIMSPALS